MTWHLSDQLYHNALASESDIEGFRLEGEAKISFANGRMRMESVVDPAEGQRANFVFWCPADFEADLAISWDFWPLAEPGLCMLFFAATGRDGHNLFDPTLARRTGEYHQYRQGDINALHISYFRRMPKVRWFHTCHLRKSHGGELVARGADPLPGVDDATPPYRLSLIKYGAEISFSINELPLVAWRDDGVTYGPVLGGGKIGLRQMAPMAAEYANLTVHRVAGEGR